MSIVQIITSPNFSMGCIKFKNAQTVYDVPYLHFLFGLELFLIIYF